MFAHSKKSAPPSFDSSPSTSRAPLLAWGSRNLAERRKTQRWTQPWRYRGVTRSATVIDAAERTWHFSGSSASLESFLG